MPKIWSTLDIDSGRVTFYVTSFFTLYKRFVIFVSWFLLAISQVYSPTLNKVIIVIKWPQNTPVSENQVITLKCINRRGVGINRVSKFPELFNKWREGWGGGDFCIFLRNAGGVVAIPKQGVGYRSG